MYCLTLCDTSEVEALEVGTLDLITFEGHKNHVKMSLVLLGVIYLNISHLFEHCCLLEYIHFSAALYAYLT